MQQTRSACHSDILIVQFPFIEIIISRSRMMRHSMEWLISSFSTYWLTGSWIKWQIGMVAKVVLRIKVQSDRYVCLLIAVLECGWCLWKRLLLAQSNNFLSHLCLCYAMAHRPNTKAMKISEGKSISRKFTQHISIAFGWWTEISLRFIAPNSYLCLYL